MTCYRFCSGMEFVFVAIIVSSFLCISMETNAIEQSSNGSKKVKSINFLIDILNMRSDLIHMEIVKIDSSEPQCVVILDSVASLMELSVFKQNYASMARLKSLLCDLNFSWFEFASYGTNRPVIFTHELIKHQPRDLCNSAAFKAPRILDGKTVPWRHNIYLPESSKSLISVQDVSVINRNTGKAEPFMPFQVLSKKRKRMQTKTPEESSNVFHKVKPISFLIDILDMHSDLIHMDIVKIDSLEPQCAVIIGSVQKLRALSEFKQQYQFMFTMKAVFRTLHFSWFEFTSSGIDRPVIFTHALIKHQPRGQCNSTAFKAPRCIHWNHNIYLPERSQSLINAKDVSVINRNTGEAEPFTFDALESYEPQSINFLIDILNMHSDIIHMEIVKIGSTEPQCVVIIDSVHNLMELSELQLKYKYMSKMKDRFRGLRFSYFEFGEKRSSVSDRPMIFTHELIKHQPRDRCNSTAFKAPRTRNGEIVPWSSSYFPESLEHRINVKDVSVINRKTGQAEQFMPIHVLRKRKKRKLDEDSPSTRIPDLNQLPNEWEFSC